MFFSAIPKNDKMSLTVSELFCYCSLLGEVVLRCINKTRSVNIERSYKNRRYDTAFKLNLRHSYSALLKVSEHRHKNIASCTDLERLGKELERGLNQV